MVANDSEFRQEKIAKINDALDRSVCGQLVHENAKHFFQSWLCEVARRFPVKIGDRPVFDNINTALIDCSIAIYERRNLKSPTDWAADYADFCALLENRLSSNWLEDFVLSESNLQHDLTCINSVKEWISEDDLVLDDLFQSYNEFDQELSVLQLDDMPDSSPNIIQLTSHKDSLRVKKNFFKRQFMDCLNADLGRIDSEIDVLRSTEVQCDITRYISEGDFKTLMEHVDIQSR
jgi:hypothetical protein